MKKYRLFSSHRSEVGNWSLVVGRYEVGRDPTCDIVIDHRTVSRRHARLCVEADQSVRVTDLHSRNGVRINRRRVRQEDLLRAGDRIAFGDVVLTLESEDGAPADTDCDSDLTIAERPTEHVIIERIPFDKALAAPAKDDDTLARAFLALSDMAGMLVTFQSLEEMCDEALERLSRIVAGQRFAVFMPSDSSDRVDVMGRYMVDPADSRTFTISRTVLREVLTEKRAVYFSDEAGDEHFMEQESIVSQGIRSAMAVPLIDKDRVMGVLYIDTTQSGRRYDEKMLKLAATCGHLLAAKITQHHLLKEQEAKQALETELRLAACMQRDLMPGVLPSVKGYALRAHLEESRMVGGDLYDVGLLTDGHVLFLQADVSGKGMGAALLASNILSAFRILRGHSSFDLADAVRQVSLQLLSSSGMSDFATLFIGVLDPVAHRIEYVNAGHNPPVFVPRNGDVRRLEYGELPIGALDDSTWTLRTLDIHPGDRLIVYTDGILDAEDGSGTTYEKERLLNYADQHREKSPAEFSAGLIDDLGRFMGATPLRDDLCVLLLERL